MTTLMIKDLSLSKELGGKEMTAVHGGDNTNSWNLNAAYGGGIASAAVVVAPVAQVSPFGFGNNTNFANANVAYGGGFASPGVVVAPVSQA